MTATTTAHVGAQRTLDAAGLLRQMTWRLGPLMAAANSLGALGVFLYLSYILPLPDHISATAKHHADIVNLIAFIPFGIVAVAVGWWMSAGRFRPIRRWLQTGGHDDHLRAYVLRHPLRQTLLHGAIWASALLVFVPINAPYGAAPTVDIAVVIALGGVTTCGVTYFMAERIMRPLTQAVMLDSTMPDPYVPGVKSRLLAAWSLGTGVPVLGLILLVVDRNGQSLSVGSVLFLACATLAAGATCLIFAARSIADPVESVTAALAEVEDGQFDVAVPVYDGSQVGRLQSGFNQMVEGLRDRERIRAMFGQQVGEDVAAQSLERGVDFRGEATHAAVLFVDVIGSTTLATTLPPAEVVRRLNRFFSIVVEVVDRTGGFVNKFEGDAALCLFGVPVPREDAAACALLAARLLTERLAAADGLSAAVGVAAGEVVAGNIGTSQRYEYTVIGDPVNVAARLSELAKSRDQHVLATAEVVNAAGEEAKHWAAAGSETLRGRKSPTRLGAPVPSIGAETGSQ